MTADIASEEFFYAYVDSVLIFHPHRDFHDLWTMYCMGDEL